MSNRAAYAIVHAIQTDVSTVSDRELLRRFASSNDQRAFAALFKRHAALVLGVCRRGLANDHDAEDACQAVFLVLVRKAKSKRWQTSIANWLYAAARKTAANSRLAAHRRIRREGKGSVAETVQPLDQMTSREFLSALDEELERLPPRYREPLVLCYLEGLTRDEAARRLEIPLNTLKSQLEARAETIGRRSHASRLRTGDWSAYAGRNFYRGSGAAAPGQSSSDGRIGHTFNHRGSTCRGARSGHADENADPGYLDDRWDTGLWARLGGGCLECGFRGSKP